MIRWQKFPHRDNQIEWAALNDVLNCKVGADRNPELTKISDKVIELPVDLP